MPQVITGKQAGNIGKPRSTWIHGLLLPVEAEFYKWADDQLDTNGKPIKDADGKKLKVAGSGGKVSYAEWVSLPDGKKGQKWFIAVDQRLYHPDWEKPTTRGVMVDFPEWVQYVGPGVLDSMGNVDKPIQEFLDRANTSSWFVEAELVHSGFYDGKPQNLPKLTRMTQDKATLDAWNRERYPKGEDTVVPQEALDGAKFVWKKIAKGDKDVFNTKINEDADLSPYLMQFAANDYVLVK